MQKIQVEVFLWDATTPYGVTTPEDLHLNRHRCESL